jgi:hypothetical protein
LLLLTEDEDDSSGIDKLDAGSFAKKYATKSIVGNNVTKALLLLTEDEDDSSGIDRSDAGSFEIADAHRRR